VTENSRLAGGGPTSNNKVISFERDINYYFQKGNKYFLKNNFKKALLYFKKTVELEPYNALNHYNLACLLSKMGQLEDANRIFAYIIEELDSSISECYFLMAINYGLMEELQEARYYLYLYLEQSPEGEMAEEARELLWALSEGEEVENSEEAGKDKEIKEKEFKEKKDELLMEIYKWNQEKFKETYQKSALFRQILKKILYFSNDTETVEIVRLLGGLESAEAKNTLKEFVKSPWIKDRLKLFALLKLQNMDQPWKCLTYLYGKFRNIDLNSYPLRAPSWKEEWEKVLVCVLNQMRKNSSLNDEDSLETVQALWLNFLNKKHPHMPRVSKPEVWAAGLEYSLVKHYYLNVTQKEISSKYGVSSSSVGSKYKQIKNMVKINRELFSIPEIKK